MTQRLRDCRIAEWAELVGANIPDWACEKQRARRERALSRPADGPREARHRERPE